MTTTKNDLTSRYVHAVTRSLPENQRADIDKELRASIADAIEARVEAGESPADAERATITELGEPQRLAGEYADRPAWLIGPKYFYSWLTVLKLLYAIVLPIVFVVLFIVGFVKGGIGEAFGMSFSVTFAVAVHLGFWMTLVFALYERYGEKGKGAKADWPAWTPDLLPEVPDPQLKRPGLSELIPSIVFSVFFVVAVIWQQYNSVFQDAEGRPIPLLNPDLWSFWIPYMFAVTAASVVFAFVLFAVRRWTWTLASINVLVTLAGAIPAIWLMFNHRVWNVELFEQFGWGDIVTRLVDPISAGVFALGAIGGIADGLVRAAKTARL